jgi:hypothetical protein
LLSPVSIVTASRHCVQAKLRSSGWPKAACHTRASRIGAPQRGQVMTGAISLMRHEMARIAAPAIPGKHVRAAPRGLSRHRAFISGHSGARRRREPGIQKLDRRVCLDSGSRAMRASGMTARCYAALSSGTLVAS